MAIDPDSAHERLRSICVALPEVSERISHGSPTFFICEKKVLCNFHPHDIHGEHGMSIWAPAPRGAQDQLVEDEPDRFYRPPYVGGRGWIGVRLDCDVDWTEIEGIVHDAYRLVAPKTLVKLLDEP